MYTYCCLNNISTIGTKHFTDQYVEVKEGEKAKCISGYVMNSALKCLGC